VPRPEPQPQKPPPTCEDPWFDQCAASNHAGCNAAADPHVGLPILVAHNVAVADERQPRSARGSSALLDVVPIGGARVALLAGAAMERNRGGAPLSNLGDELVCNVGAVVVTLAVGASGVCVWVEMTSRMRWQDQHTVGGAARTR
jgi:hypothetical protein